MNCNCADTMQCKFDGIVLAWLRHNDSSSGCKRKELAMKTTATKTKYTASFRDGYQHCERRVWQDSKGCMFVVFDGIHYTIKEAVDATGNKHWYVERFNCFANLSDNNGSKILPR